MSLLALGGYKIYKAKDNILYYLNRGSWLKTDSGKAALSSWSKEVRKRDKKCQVCNTKHNLEAHHLDDKTHYPKRALLLDNGIALCGNCHTEFHSWNGGFQARCTKSRFEKWIKTKKKGKKMDTENKLAGFVLYIVVILAVLGLFYMIDLDSHGKTSPEVHKIIDKITEYKEF